MAIETAMFRTIPFENDRIERLIDAAGALLSSSLGYKATSIPTEMFVDRWGPKRNVVRCKVDSTCPDAPDTVILRRVRDTDAYDPADTRTSGPTYQMFDYWAGASFLSTLTPEQSPMFYGGHLEGGFILIEDVGARMSVVNALAGGDSEEAEHELLDLATCLGTIHAKSAGSEAQYLELRNALS